MWCRLYIFPLAAWALAIAGACTTQTGQQGGPNADPPPIGEWAQRLSSAAAPGARGRLPTGQGGDYEGDPDASPMDLAPPEHGVQLSTRSGLWIEAGDDIRWCEVIAFPGEPGELFSTNRIEAAMAPYGSELVVYAVVPGSDTSEVVVPGERVPCNRAGEAFGEALQGLVTSQQGYLDQQYPEGVGQHFWGGQLLVVEHHYVNDSPEAVPARTVLNFHHTAASHVQHLAQWAALHNLTIYTPPQGHSTHLGECEVGEPIRISELARRTRSWGTHFRVWLLDGDGDETGELLWHSADHRDNQYEFEQALDLQPGQRLRFECSYHNTSNAELGFGATAQDEVCSLQALYWLAEDATDSDVDPVGCLLLSVDTDGIARN